MSSDHEASPGSTAAQEVLNAEQLHELLDAIASVGGELSLEVVLRRIVEGAARLVGARYGALGVLDETHTRLSEFITVGLTDDETEAIGDIPEGHGILGLLIVDPKPLRLPDLRRHPDSFGFPPHHPEMTSFLGVPIRVRGEVFGNLYLTDKEGGREFTDVDEEMAVALAAAAGTAIENARLHGRVSDLMVLEDRERIARELHDTVIQRIFATGLVLQGVAARLHDDEIARRLQSSVDDLDDTVRHIRTTIFELQRARMPGRSLRQELLDLVGELGDTFGFDTVVQFDGPIDSTLSGGRGGVLADNLLAVVRESLTNVGKHAKATRVEVRLQVASELTLTVTDNGHGLGDGAAGHGLPNMTRRAAELGGVFTASSPDSGGTTVTWEVPVDAPD